MQVDYFIVGLGLAGISFCEQLRANNKSFMVFDNESQKSSIVAAGLYNPVVLKRFTPVWKSELQLAMLKSHYGQLERRLGLKLDYDLPVYRRFASLEEQNNWFIASDNPQLGQFLSNDLIRNANSSVNAPFGFGKVLETGRIDVKTLISAYRTELEHDDKIRYESFEYSSIIITSDGIVYKNLEAKHIVFSEGYGISKNPYFDTLPLSPTKGELLIIEAPDLKIDYVLKGPVFLVPLCEDIYIVGATYDWTDRSNVPTQEAKDWLVDKLKGIITCPFEIIDHVAGIRPTVKDRKPLVGTHAEYKNVHVLNGLGTRGVMIGPYVALQLFDNIEFHKPLDEDIDIKRFN